jgi:hypothetical protein
MTGTCLLCGAPATNVLVIDGEQFEYCSAHVTPSVPGRVSGGAMADGADPTDGCSPRERAPDGERSETRPVSTSEAEVAGPATAAPLGRWIASASDHQPIAIDEWTEFRLSGPITNINIPGGIL